MPILNRSLVVALAVQMICMTASAAPRAGKDLVVGRVTREQVRQIVAQWKIVGTLEPLPANDLEELKRVRHGATVKVFLGVWCEDSKFELRQFMRLLDALTNETPFAVEFVAVDKQKRQPASEVKSNEIWYLPTFVVFRNGREIGRIVGHPPHTLERDLLLLLDGSTRGLLSSNESAIIRYLSGSMVGGSQ
jgi:hypothetical protein